MFKSYRVGSIFGIPIKFDITFVLILPIFAWIIGLQIDILTDILNRYLGAAVSIDPLLVGNWPWILGLIGAIGLFVGVILHEFGHSLLALHYGYEIDSITLWIFGGLARFTEQPNEWKHEFTIAIAGPIVSIVVGVICYGVMVLLPIDFDAARFIFGYLALMNVALAGFNMLPGFPMDGGRVFRALLARTRSFSQATELAAEVGKLFAFLLGLFGLFRLNIFLIGIAVFIYIGASGEAKYAVMRTAFEGVTVRDVMTPHHETETVSEDTSVATLLDRMFTERHTGYPVINGGQLVGIVTLEDVRAVDPIERDAFIVGDVMSRDLKATSPDIDALEAFEEMQRQRIGRLIVTDAAGNFVGILSRSELLSAFGIIESSGSVDSVRPITSRNTTDRAEDE